MNSERQEPVQELDQNLCVNEILEIPFIAWAHGGVTQLFSDADSAYPAELALARGNDALALDTLTSGSSPEVYSSYAQIPVVQELLSTLPLGTKILAADAIPRHFHKDLAKDITAFQTVILGLSVGASAGAALFRRGILKGATIPLTRRAFLGITAGTTVYVGLESLFSQSFRGAAQKLNVCAEQEVPSRPVGMKHYSDVSTRNAIVACKLEVYKELSSSLPTAILGWSHLTPNVVQETLELVTYPDILHGVLQRLLEKEYELYPESYSSLVGALQDLTVLQTQQNNDTITLEEVERYEGIFPIQFAYEPTVGPR